MAAVWQMRTGRGGEHEQRFIDDSRIYLTWRGVDKDLSEIHTRAQLKAYLEEVYPQAGSGKINNNTGQVWAFLKVMKADDLVLSPSKRAAVVHIGRVEGEYQHDPTASERYRGYRRVAWLALDVPRSSFDHDILMSLGSQLTICRIQREEADKRVLAMVRRGTAVVERVTQPAPQEVTEAEDELDLEVTAQDQIIRLIAAKYKGYDMVLLVDAILKAQGYTTYVSDKGPDKGIDILAGPGPLGFGKPRLVVQVKSQDDALGRPVLDQLVGTMNNVGADQGLLVCWGGFKDTVKRDLASYFFRVRLWDQGDLVKQLLEHYERLDADLKAEIPLKRIWVVASAEEQ